MSRFEKFGLALMMLIAVTIWAMVGLNLYHGIWQSPLGPGLALPSQAVSSSVTPPALLTRVVAPTFAFMTRQAYLAPPAPQCGGPKSMRLLAIGSDTRAEGYKYGLADVIRYVHIDFVNPSVRVLEFPRDLWVQIPDISSHYNITHGKLNQAYLYGNPGMGYYQGEGQGPGLLARTLELNFGAHADHYIAANMHTFVDLVNVLGGIDVYLPYNVDARKEDQPKRFDLYFPAGQHHLNGEQALMLGRIRQYSVFARADQQNRIMCAVREALLNPANLPKVPQLIQTFNGAVQTDLSPEEISQLACLATKIKPSDILFTTFPREMLTEARTFDIGVNKDVYIFKADFAVLSQMVQAFDLGAWPDPQPDPSIATPRPRGEGSFQCP